ncbi:hypothetical protein C8Q77DRAFT_209889 [Trametes polyzona]|nr:hypothetical protein C8Q77DRAFT_209889 [Trametes polyzona]
MRSTAADAFCTPAACLFVNAWPLRLRLRSCYHSLRAHTLNFSRRGDPRVGATGRRNEQRRGAGEEEGETESARVCTCIACLGWNDRVRILNSRASSHRFSTFVQVLSVWAMLRPFWNREHCVQGEVVFHRDAGRVEVWNGKPAGAEGVPSYSSRHHLILSKSPFLFESTPRYAKTSSQCAVIPRTASRGGEHLSRRSPQSPL